MTFGFSIITKYFNSEMFPSLLVFPFMKLIFFFFLLKQASSIVLGNVLHFRFIQLFSFIQMMLGLLIQKTNKNDAVIYLVSLSLYILKSQRLMQRLTHTPGDYFSEDFLGLADEMCLILHHIRRQTMSVVPL